MPRPNTDTREQALRVAAELFATRGYEQTSLSEISGRLGITKAALYYHFRSKGDLLRSLVEPFVHDIEALSANLPTEPRATLEAYFDLCYRHRAMLLGIVRDVAVLNELQIVDWIITWRTRIDAALTGPGTFERSGPWSRSAACRTRWCCSRTTRTSPPPSGPRRWTRRCARSAYPRRALCDLDFAFRGEDRQPAGPLPRLH